MNPVDIAQLDGHLSHDAELSLGGNEVGEVVVGWGQVLDLAGSSDHLHGHDLSRQVAVPEAVDTVSAGRYPSATVENLLEGYVIRHRPLSWP